MALKAVQDCQEKGYNISAAVMNREGRLTAFARNPMASPMTSEIAQGKAHAAITQASTANLEEIDALAYADGVVPTARVDSLSAQVDVFSEESEFQAQIRPLMKSAPRLALIR